MKKSKEDIYAFVQYEIDGSMFMALGGMDRDITDAILKLMDNQVDDLPAKEDHVQVIACAIHSSEPLYFALAYMNAPDSMTIFLSIDEITSDAYLDCMIDNRIFTQKPEA
jgi:hypothetical protein